MRPAAFEHFLLRLKRLLYVKPHIRDAMPTSSSPVAAPLHCPAAAAAAAACTAAPWPPLPPLPAPPAGWPAALTQPWRPKAAPRSPRSLGRLPCFAAPPAAALLCTLRRQRHWARRWCGEASASCTAVGAHPTGCAVWLISRSCDAACCNHRQARGLKPSLHSTSAHCTASATAL